MGIAFVPVPCVLEDGSFFDGPNPLCVRVNECPGGQVNNERGIQRNGECLCLCLLYFTYLFRTLFL